MDFRSSPLSGFVLSSSFADEIEENDSDSEGEDGETEEEEVLEYYYYYLDMTNREENAQTVINGGAGPKK